MVNVLDLSKWNDQLALALIALANEQPASGDVVAVERQKLAAELLDLCSTRAIRNRAAGILAETPAGVPDDLRQALAETDDEIRARFEKLSRLCTLPGIPPPPAPAVEEDDGEADAKPPLN